MKEDELGRVALTGTTWNVFVAVSVSEEGRAQVAFNLLSTAKFYCFLLTDSHCPALSLAIESKKSSHLTKGAV